MGPELKGGEELGVAAMLATGRKESLKYQYFLLNPELPLPLQILISGSEILIEGFSIGSHEGMTYFFLTSDLLRYEDA